MKKLNSAKLGAFKAWLERQSIEHRAGKGKHQVLQVQFDGGWHSLCWSGGSEDYTVPPKLQGLLGDFLSSKPVPPAAQESKSRNVFYQLHGEKRKGQITTQTPETPNQLAERVLKLVGKKNVKWIKVGNKLINY